MPYIKLKVSQDLFEELGLSSNMELVRSGGSVKFIPLCNKRVFDDYKSPLLTSPIFGNYPNVDKGSSKTVPNVFPCEPVLNIGSLSSVSVPANKKCKISHQESADSDSSVLASVFSKDIMRCSTDKSPDDTPQNNVSESGNKSEVIHFEDHPDLNQFSSLEGSDSNFGAFNDFMLLEESEGVEAENTVRSSARQVCPSVTDDSPVAVPSENSFNFRLPSSLEPSGSCTISASSQFTFDADNVSCIQLDSRGRLSSVTLTTPHLTSASQEVKPFSPVEEKETRCEMCFSVFKTRGSYQNHQKICDQLVEKRLKLAGVGPDCDPEALDFVNPKICVKCGLIFEEGYLFSNHLKRCEKYSKRQTISSRTEKIILPTCSDSLSSGMVTNTVDKYIRIKEEPKLGPRFFARRKAPN